MSTVGRTSIGVNGVSRCNYVGLVVCQSLCCCHQSQYVNCSEFLEDLKKICLGPVFHIFSNHKKWWKAGRCGASVETGGYGPWPRSFFHTFQKWEKIAKILENLRKRALWPMIPSSGLSPWPRSFFHIFGGFEKSPKCFYVSHGPGHKAI